MGMKILFYLPVATPWWFTERFAPLIRTLHGAAELHVMVAPLWRNTGIEGDHLAPFSDLEGIGWHIIDAGDPETFRTDGAAIPGLLDLVQDIAPDLTIARSADFRTPGLFPGTVRYLMEGIAPPYDLPTYPLVLEEKPFCMGMMPHGAEATVDLCLSSLADIWNRADAYRSPALARSWRDRLGLPAERPILAVPLQYEHEENFFLGSSAFPDAVSLARHLFETVDSTVFLAFTDHPLNLRFADRTEINALIADNSDRAAMCSCDVAVGGATALLAAYADAFLIDQSKSWSLAAYCGTPMVHIGNATLAPWLNATPVDDPRIRNWTGTSLPSADPEAMRRWFCWHMGARMFHPQELTLDRLVHHVNGTTDAAIIRSNAALLRDGYRKAA